MLPEEMDNSMASKNIITASPSSIPKLKGIGITFYEKMLEHKSKIAHTDAETGRTETYESILQKTIRTSLAMSSRGIKPNDVITICSNTTIESFVCLYASFFTGAISANIDPRLPLSDMVYLMKLAKPKMIFTIPETIRLIEQVIEQSELNIQIVVFGQTSKYLKYSDFLLPSPDENKFVPYEPNNIKDTAVIVFSSGSTGLAKGICLSHNALLGLSYRIAFAPLMSAPTLLTFANLYWISAVTLTPNAIINGVNRITCSVFDPIKIWDLIKKYKIGGLFLNAFHALEMCKYGRPKEADTSTLYSVIFGGCTTTKEQNLHIRKCLPEAIILNGYGQTETAGCVLMFDPTNQEHLELLERYPNSVGKPFPGYYYKVVNPDTEEILGPNQEGELRVKSDFLMNGFYNMDDSNEWDTDGFFKTGDIGYYNEDHCFFIVDRIKQLLKYQMWHISPVKLETVLLAHPAVHNCVVIGIPHQLDGDHAMGVVVLKDSAVGKVTEEDLQRYVDDQVGDYQKLRAGVKFVRELPVTATNKISRLQTKRIVLQERV
ncbi:hypothetical protein ILUMI_11597 [Ignelater luminosus]|uniref:Luciferin 4-monooxygenase n=1 Tax=Ignelater luminosus TaxID=2038154 RepID=A0A8K0D1V0_IGNLU|nr:hypothetical protein ILUMI_11597 [Ignelater luminosus]